MSRRHLACREKENYHPAKRARLSRLSDDAGEEGSMSADEVSDRHDPCRIIVAERACRGVVRNAFWAFYMYVW